MSIQLNAMWVLAMCAMAVMVAVSVVKWKLNHNGKLVNKDTGEPYDATFQFNSSQFEVSALSGTKHFFASNGSVMTRFANHDCDTKNCERQQMTKDGIALQNQQRTSHHGASRRVVPDGPGRSRFDIITRMTEFINLCFGTDPDVFEQQPKLNGHSDDVAVSTVARITTYLTSNDINDTDHVSELEALCREIGRGCYTEFDLSTTRSDDLPYTCTPNEQRWTCLYKIVCSPNPAGTLNTATQTRWPGLSRQYLVSFPDAHIDNVVAPMYPRSGGTVLHDPMRAVFLDRDSFLCSSSYVSTAKKAKQQAAKRALAHLRTELNDGNIHINQVVVVSKMRTLRLLQR
jgi:hypothetical protein